MADRIQLRRDSSANWASANPILAQGEPALEIDTGRLKVGDGLTVWSDLAYYSLGTVGYLSADNPVITAGSLTEDVFALSGTSAVLDPANGSIQTHVLSGATTYTDGFEPGQAITLMIDDGAGFTVSWPAITWVNTAALPPTLAQTGFTTVTLWKIGAVLYGALIGDGT